MSRARELLAELGVAGVSGGPWVVLAAHPDDEVIGATWLLAHAAPIHVVHLTDGAPRDSKLRGLAVSREAYAELRAEEGRRALAIAGVPSARVHGLGGVDQEAVLALASLSASFASLLAELEASVVVTHPYEGGHPDHDAAALVAARALARLGDRAPAGLEMASYHDAGGALRTGEFLPGPPAATRVLSPAEREAKAAMFACHASQADVLRLFAIEVERFRRAPRYDFASPPHEGPLFYETMGWISGARWREVAGC